MQADRQAAPVTSHQAGPCPAACLGSHRFPPGGTPSPWSCPHRWSCQLARSQSARHRSASLRASAGTRPTRCWCAAAARRRPGPETAPTAGWAPKSPRAPCSECPPPGWRGQGCAQAATGARCCCLGQRPRSCQRRRPGPLESRQARWLPLLLPPQATGWAGGSPGALGRQPGQTCRSQRARGRAGRGAGHRPPG